MIAMIVNASRNFYHAVFGTFKKKKLFFAKLFQKSKEVRVEDINSSIGVSFIDHA